MFFEAEDENQQKKKKKKKKKKDQELTVAQIMNSLLQNSGLNWRN